MDIVCPSCAAAYEIDEASVSETGRKVRCAACSTVWRVYPIADSGMASDLTVSPVTTNVVIPGANPYATEPAEDIFGEGSPLLRKAIEDQASNENSENVAKATEDTVVSGEAIAAMEEAIASQEVSTELAEMTDPAMHTDVALPVEPLEEEPRRAKLVRDSSKSGTQKKKSGSVLGALFNWKTASIVTAMLVAGVGIQQRETVVKTLPQTARLYATLGMPVNLRGIEIRNVASRLIDDNGVSVLVIDGDLQNMTKQKIPLPRLRFAVQGPDGQEVYVWSAQADKNSLEAGEKLNFRRRLAAPPNDGKDVSVRFLTKADTTAGIR